MRGTVAVARLHATALSIHEGAAGQRDRQSAPCRNIETGAGPRPAPAYDLQSGSAVVDLISSIDSNAVTLCTFTSEISAW